MLTLCFLRQLCGAVWILGISETSEHNSDECSQLTSPCYREILWGRGGALIQILQWEIETPQVQTSDL